MKDFIFEQPLWESGIHGLRQGSTLSAAGFLTLMERESEEDLEDALLLLEQKAVLLDISDLPQPSGTGETALRLRYEQQLVKENKLPEGLEENDPLRLYLQELSDPEEIDPQLLAQKCAQGDAQAREKLTAGSLSRVVELAKSYVGHGVLLLDLIQEGSLGLWQAVCGFASGEFVPYRDRMIRIYLARAVTMQARENGVGQKMRQTLEDFRAVDEQLLAELGRNPTLEEIAARLHLTLEEAETAAQMLENARTVSRVKEAALPKEKTAEDEMAVEDTAYFQMRQRITELLSVLSEQDAKLITLRYGLDGELPLSPEETGRRLGLTAREVTEREAAALAELRK